jgi:hypothetical protein
MSLWGEWQQKSRFESDRKQHGTDSEATWKQHTTDVEATESNMATTEAAAAEADFALLASDELRALGFGAVRDWDVGTSRAQQR